MDNSDPLQMFDVLYGCNIWSGSLWPFRIDNVILIVDEICRVMERHCWEQHYSVAKVHSLRDCNVRQEKQTKKSTEDVGVYKWRVDCGTQDTLNSKIITSNAILLHTLSPPPLFMHTNRNAAIYDPYITPGPPVKPWQSGDKLSNIIGSHAGSSYFTGMNAI